MINIRRALSKTSKKYSSQYYNVETYEVLISNLLDNFDKHNQQQDKHYGCNNK
jgi:hypothetical protein